MNSALEATQYFPRPGRTAPARLQLVRSNLFEEEERTACQPSLTWDDILRMRGELPAPKRATKPARGKAPHAPPTFTPPYLRKGYRWDLMGEALHEHLRHEASKPAAIRPCPPTLEKLLATPEWKGSTVEDPTPADLHNLKKSATLSLLSAKDAERLAKGKANKARAAAHVVAHEARLERLHEARRVVHPSGAVLLWLPL